jgi:hypothetical protein
MVRNRQQFDRLLARARCNADGNRLDRAAASAEMAAARACTSHPGFFTDRRLEQLLQRISGYSFWVGRDVVDVAACSGRAGSPSRTRCSSW